MTVSLDGRTVAIVLGHATDPIRKWEIHQKSKLLRLVEHRCVPWNQKESNRGGMMRWACSPCSTGIFPRNKKETIVGGMMRWACFHPRTFINSRYFGDCMYLFVFVMWSRRTIIGARQYSLECFLSCAYRFHKHRISRCRLGYDK